MIRGAEFDEATHTYRWQGRVVPSVTQCLEAAGLSDYSGVPPDVLAAAQWRGQEVHRFARLLWEGQDCRESVRGTELDGYCSGVWSFWRESGFDPHTWEAPDIGERDGLRFGYTLDAIGVLGGKVIVDFKTGAPSKGWGPQLAAYAEQQERRDGVRRARVIVRVRRDGSYHLVPLREDANDLRIWAAALAIAYYKGGF